MSTRGEAGSVKDEPQPWGAYQSYLSKKTTLALLSHIAQYKGLWHDGMDTFGDHDYAVVTWNYILYNMHKEGHKHLDYAVKSWNNIRKTYFDKTRDSTWSLNDLYVMNSLQFLLHQEGKCIGAEITEEDINQMVIIKKYYTPKSSVMKELEKSFKIALEQIDELEEKLKKLRERSLCSRKVDNRLPLGIFDKVIRSRSTDCEPNREIKKDFTPSQSRKEESDRDLRDIVIEQLKREVMEIRANSIGAPSVVKETTSIAKSLAPTTETKNLDLVPALVDEVRELLTKLKSQPEPQPVKDIITDALAVYSQQKRIEDEKNMYKVVESLRETWITVIAQQNQPVGRCSAFPMEQTGGMDEQAERKKAVAVRRLSKSSNEPTSKADKSATHSLYEHNQIMIEKRAKESAGTDEQIYFKLRKFNESYCALQKWKKDRQNAKLSAKSTKEDKEDDEPVLVQQLLEKFIENGLNVIKSKMETETGLSKDAAKALQESTIEMEEKMRQTFRKVRQELRLDDGEWKLRKIKAYAEYEDAIENKKEASKMLKRTSEMEKKMRQTFSEARNELEKTTDIDTTASDLSTKISDQLVAVDDAIKTAEERIAADFPMKTNEKKVTVDDAQKPAKNELLKSRVAFLLRCKQCNKDHKTWHGLKEHKSVCPKNANKSDAQLRKEKPTAAEAGSILKILNSRNPETEPVAEIKPATEAIVAPKEASKTVETVQKKVEDEDKKDFTPSQNLKDKFEKNLREIVRERLTREWREKIASSMGAPSVVNETTSIEKSLATTNETIAAAEVEGLKSRKVQWFVGNDVVTSTVVKAPVEAKKSEPVQISKKVNVTLSKTPKYETYEKSGRRCDICNMKIDTYFALAGHKQMKHGIMPNTNKPNPKPSSTGFGGSWGIVTRIPKQAETEAEANKLNSKPNFTGFGRSWGVTSIPKQPETEAEIREMVKKLLLHHGAPLDSDAEEDTPATVTQSSVVLTVASNEVQTIVTSENATVTQETTVSHDSFPHTFLQFLLFVFPAIMTIILILFF